MNWDFMYGGFFIMGVTALILFTMWEILKCGGIDTKSDDDNFREEA